MLHTAQRTGECTRAVERVLRALQIRHDEHVIVFWDKYPKAACHFLVVPREEGVYDLSCLTLEHLPLLDRMVAAAQTQIGQLPDDVQRVRTKATVQHVVLCMCMKLQGTFAHSLLVCSFAVV